MIIAVQESGVSYTDTDNFTRFHIDANELAPSVFANQAAASSALNYDAEAGVVWVQIAALREVVDPAHTADFDGMISFATSKGWVTEDGTQVRGHIENLGA